MSAYISNILFRPAWRLISSFLSALITELVAGARLPEPEIASSMVHALACVATSAGSNFGAASKTAVEELVLETFENSGTGASLPIRPLRWSTLTFLLSIFLRLTRADAYIEAMSRVIGGLALHDVEAVRPVFEYVAHRDLDQKMMTPS